MIYVIKTNYYDYKVEKPLTLIKIGFSEDNSWEKRLIHYKLHNPLCEVIRIISNATKDHESRLHYKFHDLLFSGREWFVETKEMLDYLLSITLEDLNSLPTNPGFGKSKNYTLLKRRDIQILLEYVLKEEGREDITTDDFKEMLKVVKYESTTCESIFEDLKSSNHYPSITLKTWNEIESSLFPPLPSEISRFFLQYDQLTTWVDKIHYIVDYTLENIEKKDAIISNLADSDKIKQQLITLGPERIKGLGYHITKINQAMGIVDFDKSQFLEEVYSEFVVGERYTKKYIKEKLGELYKKMDYKRTPKAVDLEEWFQIKTCKVLGLNRKREECFKIISKK